MVGTSTPSVKHLALDITAFSAFLNSFKIWFLRLVGCLPLTENEEVVSTSCEWRFENVSASFTLEWNVKAWFALYSFII